MIFGSNTNTPEFHITSPKRYTFFTPNDDGTGTNYKGLVVMDIATLQETALPLLVHDSVLLKQISNESIEKIFELYNQSAFINHERFYVMFKSFFACIHIRHFEFPPSLFSFCYK